jgi:hypothetical protein
MTGFKKNDRETSDSTRIKSSFILEELKAMKVRG